jgi:hypothetical protein
VHEAVQLIAEGGLIEWQVLSERRFPNGLRQQVQGPHYLIELEKVE